MKKSWSQQEINTIKSLVDEKTNKELSELFNVSDSSIEHVLKRNDIYRKYNKYKRKEITYSIQENKTLKTPCHNCTSHQVSPNGYPMKKVNREKQLLARYVYEQYHHCTIEKGLVLRHKCDNKLCINIEHLEIGTPKDNIHDAIKRNRNTKGSKVNTALLIEQQVKEIKEKLKDRTYGYAKKLAQEYNVSSKVIQLIANNKTWKHIK